jgi:hypothetical protein
MLTRWGFNLVRLGVLWWGWHFSPRCFVCVKTRFNLMTASGVRVTNLTHRECQPCSPAGARAREEGSVQRDVLRGRRGGGRRAVDTQRWGWLDTTFHLMTLFCIDWSKHGSI